MLKPQVIFVILFLVLLTGCGSRDKAGPADTGAVEIVQEKTIKKQVDTAELTTKQTHLGGCILVSPAIEAPADPYLESDIVPTEEYKPFTKKLLVYGITLIGRDDISDAFMKKVAKTIKAMFPRSGSTDAKLQEEVLKNLYRYKAVIPLFKGHEHEFTPADKKLWEVTTSRNSICDIIMEGVPGQVNEVVEHILHYVTDIGLHYAMPADWGISKTSKVYWIMQEAIDKKYYDIKQYNEEPEEEKDRIQIQEYAYWIIYCGWDLRETFGPKQAEFSIMSSAELKDKLPGSYRLVSETIPKIMAAPGQAMLEDFFQ